MGKQVGVGWFKMIQARETHTIQNDPSQKFNNIQAKTLPYTITYNPQNAKNELLKLLPEVLVGFASGFNRGRIIFNKPGEELGTIDFVAEHLLPSC